MPGLGRLVIVFVGMSRPSPVLLATAAATNCGAPARCCTLRPADKCFRHAVRASESVRACGCFAFTTTGAKLQPLLATTFNHHAHRQRREALASGLIISIAFQRATMVPTSVLLRCGWDQATGASTRFLSLQRLEGSQRFVFQASAYLDPRDYSFYAQTTTSLSHTSADTLREKRTGAAK